MGYTTEFEGSVTVTPPLNEAEVAYLKRFNYTRRVSRANGPYFVSGSGNFGQGRHDEDIWDYNNPPDGQPGLWCGWIPSDDGTSIGWDGGEKFYYATEWMIYLINHFLKPGALASACGDPQFAAFTFDHVVDGVIHAQGEDHHDTWRLVVTKNRVTQGDPDEQAAIEAAQTTDAGAHLLRLDGAPKIDAPDLVRAVCSCGDYTSSVDSPPGATRAWLSHWSAKTRGIGK